MNIKRYKILETPALQVPRRSTQAHTANVNRQTADKLLFSYAIITGENV